MNSTLLHYILCNHDQYNNAQLPQIKTLNTPAFGWPLVITYWSKNIQNTQQRYLAVDTHVPGDVAQQNNKMSTQIN